jgi:hypothetical protein
MRRTTVTVTARHKHAICTMAGMIGCPLQVADCVPVVLVRPLFAVHFKVFANVSLRKGPRGSPGPNFTNQNDRNLKQGRCQWELEDSEVEAGSASADELQLGRVPLRVLLSR